MEISESSAAIRVTLKAYLEMLADKAPLHPATTRTRELLAECEGLSDPGAYLVEKAGRMGIEGIMDDDSVQILIAHDLKAIARGFRLPEKIGHYYPGPRG